MVNMLVNMMINPMVNLLVNLMSRCWISMTACSSSLKWKFLHILPVSRSNNLTSIIETVYQITKTKSKLRKTRSPTVPTNDKVDLQELERSQWVADSISTQQSPAR